MNKADENLEMQALAGVKVLDFGWAIAGTMVTKYLGDHGAEVVRVESTKRMDAVRMSRGVSVILGRLIFSVLTK